jgi:hypothetical protein
MQHSFTIYRVWSTGDHRHLQRMQGVINHTRAVLRENPAPDLFIGRRTQEPFPTADDVDDVDWTPPKLSK